MSDSTARLEGWKLSLLDLTTSNRLLDAVAGIALPEVDILQLTNAMMAGNAHRIEVGARSDLETGRLRTPLAADDLDRRLTVLRRTARRVRAGSGEHVVWLALGELLWCEPDGTTHAAPLAVLPVEVVRREGTFEIVASGDRTPRINAVLVDKLRRDFDLVLATPASRELELAGLLEAATGLAVTRPGWQVAPTAQLGSFALARHELWNDLQLQASPEDWVQLATRGAAGLPPMTAAALADVIAPLDADASQLAAIAAAGAGASFVLQGPPGTGKSQTIANLIAHCATQGKTVLFVAAKQAALEVVQARLASVGLGELCLPIGDGAAPAMLAQLGRVLDRAFRPGAGPSGPDGRLAELRATLDSYVAALHASGPFGRPLHEVIGRLVELRSTPCAALAERDATGLDRGGFDRRKLAVDALARAAVAVEPVSTHPWRASTLGRWPLAGDDARDRHERTLKTLAEARDAAEELAGAAAEVLAICPGILARDTTQLDALGVLASLAAASPRPGAELLTQLRPPRGDELGERIALIRARGTGTVEVPRDPAAFLALAARHRALATEVDDRFSEGVVELDVAALWSQLKKWTGSVAPLRFVALRAVRAEVRAAALVGELNSDEAMIDALEAAIAERACRVALVAAAEPARRWFGELGGDPLALDLAKVDAAVSWAAELRRAFDALEVTGGDAGRAGAWRALVAQVSAGTPKPVTATASLDDLAPFARAADAVARWQPALHAVAEATGIPVTALGTGDDHLANLREQSTHLELAIGSLRDWVGFHAARHDALAAGVGPAVTAIERGDLGADELALAWERATLLAWGDAELAETPELSGFLGAAHHAQVAAFADMDRAALALSRTRALSRLAERVPSRRAPDPTGEMTGLLEALERAKASPGLEAGARGRDLLAAIPGLLPKLAPCIMASPVAVARHLDPTLPRFDVVVFDEASQLPMAHALGAIARANAVVVVGDRRQLPPGPADDTQPALESVLDAAVAAGLPELRLTAHYRSKHEDLFAFANRSYYGDRLALLPIAQGSPDLGISWRRVDGLDDHVGATRVNRGEAEAIVADVVGRLRDPAQRTRSIAVVTFAPGQQELIEDLLDAERASDAALDAVFAELAEPVLVEVVDAIQGDERDVVFVSVGYGPDADGVLGENLAALSRRDEQRRLCVATTRAREQLVVVSSVAPEDLATTDSPGARDLADLIAFARAGGGAAKPVDEAAPASPITAAIARALGDRGWIVRHQVGCGAYKLDLAVVDPNDPERYVLAIEHDGASYASAPAARDRDRLRPQLLASLGWRLHRIWTLDWWGDTEREIQRAHGAIVAAIASTRQRRAPVPVVERKRSTSSKLVALGSAPVVRIPPVQPRAERGRLKPTPPLAVADASAPVLDATPVTLLDAGITLASGSGPAEVTDAASAPLRLRRGSLAIGPYSAAAIPAGRRAPDDMFAPRHLAELGKVVEQVLAAEAPIHIDLLARRVGAYFGIGRLSQRVTDQVKSALDGRGTWGTEPGVVWRLDQDPTTLPAVRVASSIAGGASLIRAIDEIPLAELAAAARIVVERAAGIGATDLVRDTARLLGFARITEQVTARVSVGVRLAAQRELIRIADGRATLLE